MGRLEGINSHPNPTPYFIGVNYQAKLEKSREFISNLGANKHGVVRIWAFLLIQTSGRNRDFELKNGSGFYLQGFIAGEGFIPTT